MGSFSRRRKWARRRCCSVSLEGCWLAGNETYRVLQQRRQQEGKKVLAVRQEGKETVGGHHFVSQREHRRARGE